MAQTTQRRKSGTDKTYQQTANACESRTKNKLIPKSTITFIRNKRRDAFTFIREDGTIEELTFLEAVKEFEARLEEKSIPLHDKHHEQVAKALEVFSEKKRKIRRQ